MPETVTAEVAAFLDDLLADTHSWMADAANQRGMRSSIVVLANEGYDPAIWRNAASLPGVAHFGSTAFWLFYEIPPADMEPYLTLWAERILEATAGTSAAPMGWVQAFAVPAGREPEIERAVKTFTDSGVTTIAVWSYRACEAMSGLAAADPVAAWAAVERAFATINANTAG
jgi:hypothetical protein